MVKKLFHGKNLAILILSILLLGAIFSQPTNNINQQDIDNLNNKITQQEQQIEEYKTEIEKIKSEKEELKKQIDDLKTENENLTTKNKELNDTNDNLKNENETLRNSAKNNTSTSSATTQANNQSNNNNNTQMVWVGNTGTKYHVKGCRTLKGGGHEITYQQAIAEGREACKVCH